MYRKIEYVAIEFEMWDIPNGFFITVRVPWSWENWQGVMAIKSARNYQKIRA